jgi:hypothetical protein
MTKIKTSEKALQIAKNYLTKKGYGKKMKIGKVDFFITDYCVVMQLTNDFIDNYFENTIWLKGENRDIYNSIDFLLTFENDKQWCEL